MLWGATKIRKSLGLESTTARSDFEDGLCLKGSRFKVSGCSEAEAERSGSPE